MELAKSFFFFNDTCHKAQFFFLRDLSDKDQVTKECSSKYNFSYIICVKITAVTFSWVLYKNYWSKSGGQAKIVLCYIQTD